MKGCLLLSLAAVSACSPTPGLKTGPTMHPVRVVGAAGSTSLAVRQDDGMTSGLIAYSPDAVWSALPAVFDSLAIPVTRSDKADMILGTDGFRVRQRLARVPLSRYFDCGTTQVGPNADSYEVFLIVISRLKPAAAGTTTVEVSINARARPVAFSQAYSACVDTGALDTRFRALLRAELARRTP